MPDDLRAAFADGLSGAESADPDDVASLPPSIIPAEWWERRPGLTAVRDHAIGRFVSPDGFLAHVLAEVALRVPVDVRLPPIIGGPVPVNFGAVIVGETGTGKTTGGRSTLADAASGYLSGEVAPLGTGEGLAAALLDPPANRGERPTPHGRPVLVMADEGRVLQQLVERQGSRLLGDLCTAISGGDLGQRNATENLNRYVPAGTYRVAVLLGIQPMYLDGVIADVDGGLPQRFWFVRLSGHLLDLTAQPPADALTIPDPSAWRFPGGFVNVPLWMREEIRTAHVERMRAIDRGEPVAASSHRMLLRLRLAVLLALLDSRSAPDGDDWKLAATLVDTSDAVVALGAALRAEQARARARAETERHARHAVASDVAVTESRVDRLARKLTAWVRAQPGQSRRDMSRRLSGDDRRALDDALDHATAHGWIEERAEPGQGDDRRALYPGQVGL